MIFVDRNKVAKPSIFSSKEVEVAEERLKEFYGRPADERAQEKYSKPFRAEIRNGFLPALAELFHGKCAYCESPIDPARAHSVYDHFRPRYGARGLEKEFSNDHYWWLTYEWNNIYYCCETCNQYKSTWFPVEGQRVAMETAYDEMVQAERPLLVDPCRDQPEKHFTYKPNGEIDFLTPEGRVTIEILKLNRSELVEARKDALIRITTEWSTYQMKYSKSKKVAGSMLTDYFLGVLQDNTNTAYLGIQRAFLQGFEQTGIYEYMFGEEPGMPELVLREEGTVAYQAKGGLDEVTRRNIEQKIDLDAIRHIYVEKIEVKNFKCFSSLEVDFKKNGVIRETEATDKAPLAEPWLLFLGDNGVGKSSLLKAMVIGLSGSNYIGELGITGSELLKHGETEGYIKIYFVGKAWSIEVNFDERSIRSNIQQPIVNFVAYNSIRLMPKIGRLAPEETEYFGAKAKNLFDYTYSLTDGGAWLLQLNKEAFGRAALALKDLMMLGDDERIERNEQTIYVARKGEQVRIEELSDGYQSVYAMAVDIMSTLAGENVTYDLAEGMVFIDEIGTHLHPRWRMRVVGQLRNCFPRIRFVVTTHEPLCLRGLKNGEIVVLMKSEDKEIVAITDLPDPSSLRVDQLLTSEFFGLKSTIDPETEKIFEEYYAILALDEVDRTREQKTRLLHLNELIPKIKNLGETLREELICDVVDELLAKRVRKDGIKIQEEIKRQAIERVQNLWNEIE